MDKVTVSENRCYPDDRGELYVSELGKDLPFTVKRVYYITGVIDSTVRRGYHAHKDLRQMMFCVGGSCKVLFDDGRERTEVVLDTPGKCVLVEPGVWREMSDFTEKATLIVLASEIYDEADYIRDYKQFLEYTRSGVTE